VHQTEEGQPVLKAEGAGPAQRVNTAAKRAGGSTVGQRESDTQVADLGKSALDERHTAKKAKSA